MAKILCISGSVRKESTCVVVLNTIAERHARRAAFQVYDQLASIPHFDPDVDENALPEIVTDFRRKVANADAVIFCTPEYVFSVPAILKNAIEWCVASTVFSDKATAMIVASGNGKLTFESLALVLHTIGVRMPPESTLLFSGVRGRMQGKLHISNESDLAKLDALVDSLLVP